MDRAKLDNPSATLVVLARTDGDNYVVGNSAGVYKDYVSRSYLTPVPNATPELVGLADLLASYLDPVKNKTLDRVSIRKIAAADSQAGIHVWCGWYMYGVATFLTPPYSSYP